MKLKVAVVAIAVTILSANYAMAQQRGEKMDCAEMAKRRTESLNKAVTLNEKQTKEASEIFLKYCEESRQLRKDGNREEAMKMREKNEKDIDAILTPEQQKLWKKAKEEMAERAKSRGRR